MASRNSVVSRRKESAGKSGENFKVAVRVRPLIDREIKADSSCCARVDEECKMITVSRPSSKRKSMQIGIEDFGEIIRTDTSQTHNFFYDIIFDPETTQDFIFDECVKDIVESVLDGYNGSIIASGQTGSGKTYTIEGGFEENKGVIPRAAEMIFQYIQNYPNKTDRFLVRVSFLEIYNEKISDLMDQNRENLKIREDGVGGVYIETLSEHVVRNTDGIMSLLHKGAGLRTTASTRMNKESSRSHAVFTIIVEHATYDGSGGNVVTIGKLRLVDLAGSEKLDMDAQSRQQEETKNINVSLHTFGKVVTALTTPGVKHIPYRDSKLTRILQDSLGGNCKTALIATITPVSSCYTETMNTLKFAKRAKSIKNTASINKDMSQKALLSAYQLEIKKLKDQLNRRDSESSREEIEKMERDVIEAQKEKDEVLSQLKAHQRIVSQKEQEKNELLEMVQKLEKMLLHSKGDINETEEFKKAVKQEQVRIRRETESELEFKLAELESEKRRLESERAEVEKQKEYFAKLKAEYKPKEEVDGEFDQIASVKRKPSLSAEGNRPIPGLVLKKPNTAPNSSSSSSSFPFSSQTLPHPGSRGNATIGNPLLTKSRRTASADALASRVPHGWVQADHTPSMQSIQAHVQLDSVSAAALRDYALALAHPMTGIPCQEMSTGVRIFTGSDCVKWFRQNMVGITSVQQAQDVGQRLMDLGVFMEIKGKVQFIVSDQVYYQFSETPMTMQHQQNTTARLQSAQSLQFHPQAMGPGSGGRRPSINSTHEMASPTGPHTLASTSTHSGWEQVSTLSLDQSFVSLPMSSPDPMEQYHLDSFSPTELHLSALYGDRGRLKSLVQELSVDCLDTAGHTPLMYAIMGRQQKCCLQLLRLNANINAVNQYGQSPLLLATALEFHDLVKTLLKNGAQTHLVNQQGETAFHLASKSRNSRCLDYLCKYSPELHGINERSHTYQTPLHTAVLADCHDNVRRLLAAKADLGVSDDEGRTALHYTVDRTSSPFCAQVIVDAVPNDINLVDKEKGWSALHLACWVDSPDIADILVSCSSCDLNLKDKDGATPLHLAVHSNSVSVVSHLLSKGASTNIKNSKGKTALQLCLQLGHNECGRLITTKGDIH